MTQERSGPEPEVREEGSGDHDGDAQEHHDVADDQAAMEPEVGSTG